MAHLFFARHDSARQTAVAAPPAGHPPSTSPAGLRHYEDLHRRAVWGMLSDQARMLELAQLPQRPSSKPHNEASATSAKAPYGYRNDLSFQAWLADLASKCFQPTAVSAIRAWLDEAPRDAHLFVGGPPNSGRLSIVTTLARQAMAEEDPPPDYCYVPDPAALHRHTLLELPAGAGDGFQAALKKALQSVTEHAWPEAKPDSAITTSQHSNADAQTRLVDRAFSDLRGAAPDEVKRYINNLYLALEQALHSSNAPDLAPVELFESPHCPDGDSGSAPVVVALESIDSLLCARGGILILSAASLATGWSDLRMALRMGRLDVSKYGGLPLPLPLRVIVIGTLADANGLSSELPDFLSLFRYLAVFDSVVKWDACAEAAYAALAHEIAMLAQVPELDPSGVAYLIEEGARRVGSLNRTHLTTLLTTIGDLIIETGQYALDAQRGATGQGTPESAALPFATGAHIHEVILRRRHHLEDIRRDELEWKLLDWEHVPTDSAEVGAITGLGVGNEPFEERNYGSPFRLTATVSPSEREKLVDIEREGNSANVAKTDPGNTAADADHIIGKQAVVGYLAWKYVQQRPIEQQHPICLRARLRDEEVSRSHGPSASAATLFALLSALANVPIFRSFAVTGDISQHGELLTIGGVNYKIEGFWELCKARWERGERPEHGHGYGVLIPAANAQELMLRPEIAERIARDGWFAVYPISTIDEGLPILTGRSAEEIHTLARRTLDRFYEIAHRGKA